MLRVVGLENDLAGRISPAGPAGDLKQELKHALAGSEVRKIEGNIGADNSHQGDVREIMAFCHHLRADQNIRCPVPEILEHFQQRSFGELRYPCPSGPRLLREQRSDGCLDFFRSHSQKLDAEDPQAVQLVTDVLEKPQ